MASQPAYAATPAVDVTSIAATANTNYDGTGTITTIATGTANGKRITRVRVNAKGTVSAAFQVNFFYSPNNGTNWYFLGSSAAMPVNTVSTTNPATEVLVADLIGFELVGTAALLGAAPTTATAAVVVVESGTL